MRWLLLSVSLLLPAVVLAGGGFGYVRATSQLGKDAPLNLFDGRMGSVWCEGAKGDGVGERVVIGFKEPVMVDEVRVVNGDTRGRQGFAVRGRVQQLELRDEDSRHVVALADKGQEQVVKLDPLLETDRLEMAILAVYPGDAGESVCLAEVALYSEGRRLVGEPEVARFLKRGSAALMGRWYAGARGARDRVLDFYADGTYHYWYRPFDPEEPSREHRGEYSFDGKVLKLRSEGKAWDSLELRRIADVAPDGAEQTLLVIGASLEQDLAGQWADKP